MSTNPDDGLGLSPAERDFALRRMPVNDPLVEAYHAANVVPADLGAPVTAVDRAAILRAADRLHELGSRLYRQHDYRSSHNALAIERDIREALK